MTTVAAALAAARTKLPASEARLLRNHPSVIGFLIVRFSADPIAAIMPVAARIRGDEAVTASTAILLCIRNELPERMIRNIEPMLAGIPFFYWYQMLWIVLGAAVMIPVYFADERHAERGK